MLFPSISRPTLALPILVCTAPPAVACVVGDLLEPPRIFITMSPPACCDAEWAGTIAGTVSNVDTEDVIVVLYSQTDVYYVQPFVGSTLHPSCGGIWSSGTYGGARYLAVLARSGWSPREVLAEPPPVGGDVLAVAMAPDSQRRLEFAGRTWIVKSSGEVPFGPGPNLWSDAPENVWVDADGLHLMLVERHGNWTCAEVMSEGTIGYGRLRFEVDGPIDALDPAVVFSGFFYSDQGDEADIEWSRWGDPSRPTNAQFAVQPDAVQPFALDLGASTSTHEIVWRETGIDFASCDGPGGTQAAAPATWTYAGAVPKPDFERVHFNLWLVNGMSPQSGAVEVVVRSFSTGEPTDAPDVVTAGARLHAATFARNMLRYNIELPEPARVQLRLFDPRGRLVTAMTPVALGPGVHARVWDPSAAGVRLGNGVYFLRLDGAGPPRTARVVVLR